MCGAFPTLRGSKKLSSPVEAAAKEAYERMPGAADKAELLAAYLDDRTPTDRYRNKFYRPVSQIKFFGNLEDVVRHAELWQREMGWSKAKPKPTPKPKETAGPPATEAERKEFMQFLRETSSGKADVAFKAAVLQRRDMTPDEEAEAKRRRAEILQQLEERRQEK